MQGLDSFNLDSDSFLMSSSGMKNANIFHLLGVLVL